MRWTTLLVTLFMVALLLVPGFASAQENTETADGTNETEITPGILPDSPFYGLKQFGEKLQLMFTFNQQAKVKLNMKFAEKRLVEAEQMMLKNKTQIVERLMVRYEDCVEEAEQTREQLRLRNITLEDVDEYMNQTTSKHIAVIQRVMQNAPEQAQSGLQTALQNAETNKEKIKARITERIERRAGETGAATQTQEQTQAQTGTEAEGSQTQTQEQTQEETQEQTGTQSGQSGQGQSD